MNPEITLLILTAATVAFVHTLLGPDHYLPFVAMARARGWSLAKTLRITLACGAGHLAGSVLLGLAGILLGLQLSSLEWLESMRGKMATWLLIGFGLAYLAWGLRQAWRNRPHTHWHAHDGVTHSHQHTHHADHAHLHREARVDRSLGPWLVFLIFVLGPCEPLIPLLMYPAARESMAGVLAVTTVFGLVTIATMLLTVYLAALGLGRIRLQSIERYSHAIAGGAILACGLGVAFLGL
jgi:ABC-type nickel/cobalt efflux system permease component RcnA